MGIIVIILVVVCAMCMLLTWSQRRETAKLRKEEKVKADFIRNMSHEIRTPLHTVSGLAEVIANDALYLSKDEKNNICDQIKGNAAIIATILDEMMKYVDSSATGHNLEYERISPNQLCLHSIETFGQQYANVFTKAKLTFKRTLSDDFFFNTDPHIVQLILNKLIANACRFTEEGEVTVGCNTTETPDRLTIYVQDTGQGIPEDRIDAIFNWFDNPEASKDVAEMDLSIAYRMAQQIGGVVSLDRMYSKGTRLMLILPLR